MKTTRDKENPPFDFKTARRVTPDEHKMFCEAADRKLGRPHKPAKDLYRHVHMRIAPGVLARIRAKAHKQGIGYQTLINQILSRTA